MLSAVSSQGPTFTESRLSMRQKGSGRASVSTADSGSVCGEDPSRSGRLRLSPGPPLLPAGPLLPSESLGNALVLSGFAEHVWRDFATPKGSHLRKRGGTTLSQLHGI